METPANIAGQCDDLSPFKGDTLGDLLSYTTDMADEYHQCSAKQKSLADFSRKTR